MPIYVVNDEEFKPEEASVRVKAKNLIWKYSSYARNNNEFTMPEEVAKSNLEMTKSGLEKVEQRLTYRPIF